MRGGNSHYQYFTILESISLLMDWSTNFCRKFGLRARFLRLKHAWISISLISHVKWTASCPTPDFFRDLLIMSLQGRFSRSNPLILAGRLLRSSQWPSHI